MSTSRASWSGGRKASRPADEVHSISTVQEAPADEQSRRTRIYFIQMVIRVVCFVAAVAVEGWLRWVLVAAAVVLPYTAVIFANAGSDRRDFDADLVTERAPAALPATVSAQVDDDEVVASGKTVAEDGTPLPGRVIEHQDDAADDAGTDAATPQAGER
ncbi:DUF3099 domain-containing protein [Antribacter gilvus]|uniref:DUF3099 domain-containing protein n=1 Tax=Antribacter gilvus TaxID=2304675 RepID=UPI000F78814F|nr:DUF3099 domain-containing protein [Antribacter gilvus]